MARDPDALAWWVAMAAFAGWSCYDSASGKDATACPGGQVLCAGECRDLEDDRQNCGACGRACSVPRGDAACVGRTCVVAACDDGFGDCDGLAGTGCETDLRASPSDCGSCGAICEFPHAEARCAEGGCAVAACDVGYADCDGGGENGCEADVSADVASCGDCGNACGAPTGTVGCSEGRCVILACPEGTGDCNDDPADGCEADLLWDGRNCGGCGRFCWWEDCGPACNWGECYIAEGDLNWIDCNCDPRDGLETFCPSPYDCDFCGNRCSTVDGGGSHGVVGCVRCWCHMTGCDPGFADCDGYWSDGCEVETSRDGFNCGGCGVVCPDGTACVGGSCT